MALVLSSAGSTPPDSDLVNPPSDSVSAVSFSPTADILAVSSWDSTVRLYETNAQGQSQGKAEYKHEGPVMDLCWVPDGSKVISCGADKAARMYDLATGQSSQVAAHDAPIRSCRYVPQANGSGFLVTGSWDKTLKYWDLRTPNPVSTVTLPDKVYTLDVVHPLMVVGCANKSIQIFDLNNPGVIFKSQESPLKHQTRVVSCFPTAKGFAVGSIEGRVAIQHMDKDASSKNFSFKCHRLPDAPKAGEQVAVHSVNAMAFHRTLGTFATAGSDGRITFWDHENRSKLKTLDAASLSQNPTVPTPPSQATPIVSLSFNSSHSILAAGISYDWGKGHGGNTPSTQTRVRLHMVKHEEVNPKNRAR
ncbi:mRNA export protein (contains WD40 repeats) [Phaffia rhodozyma]|uniref:mRNA export protein (Contains WD40 repeats) n=1 Tax=Phaffia rhodozyma TaxID=264483 RepID=A0A0F7SKA8_PHARH|nr:mRNA export protein (contains WD40 repeats) [Phaffia rhodozyma]